MSQVDTHEFANGDRMPLLGLGTWKSDPGEVHAAVREAIAAGYRHIDCASFYGNEAEVGTALAEAMAAGEVTRDELFVVSKAWGNAHGRDGIEPALRASLADLQLDHLDLYMVHWPFPLRPHVGLPATPDDFAPLSEVPIHETWEAMEAVLDAGLTRHIGVSNFSVKKLGDLLERCRTKPEVNQVELHPLLQQRELVEFCVSHGVHVTAYSPLGSGDRPAFLVEAGAPVLLDEPVIGSIAASHGCSPAQVLLAWHLQRGGSVLAKSVSPVRLRENLAAADVELTEDDLARMAGLDRGTRLITGDIWVVEGGPWTCRTVWDE